MVQYGQIQKIITEGTEKLLWIIIVIMVGYVLALKAKTYFDKTKIFWPGEHQKAYLLEERYKAVVPLFNSQFSSACHACKDNEDEVNEARRVREAMTQWFHNEFIDSVREECTKWTAEMEEYQKGKRKSYQGGYGYSDQSFSAALMSRLEEELEVSWDFIIHQSKMPMWVEEKYRKETPDQTYIEAPHYIRAAWNAGYADLVEIAQKGVFLPLKKIK